MFTDYPKIMTEISAVTPPIVPTLAVDGVNFFKVFISEKGQDGKILTFTDPNLFLEEYFGNSKINYKKHGQHPYDILNILRNNGIVHCLRVCPSSNIGDGIVETIFTASIGNGFTVVPDPDTVNIITEDEDETEVTTYSGKYLNIGPRFVLTLSGTNTFSKNYLINIGKKGYIVNGTTSLTFKIIDVISTKKLLITLNDFSTFDDMNEGGWNDIDVEGNTNLIQIDKYNPAILSNLIIDFQTKKVNNKSQFRIVYKSSKVLESFEDLKNNIIASEDNPDHELNDNSSTGWTSHIIMGITSLGKGNYYNNFGIEISEPIENNLEKYNFLTYNFMIYNFVDGRKVYTADNFIVSFDPNAIDENGNSLFIENILMKYLPSYNFIFNEANYRKFIEDINTNASSKLINAGNLDIISKYIPIESDMIYSSELANLIKNNIELVTTIADNDLYINPNYDADLFVTSTSSYQNLLNGSNGSLDTENFNSDFYDLVNTLYKEAFSGLVTNEVFDRKKFPIDIILDGNYHKDVKKVMKSFLDNPSRKNSILILDATTTNPTAMSVKEFFRDANNEINPNVFNIALYGQTLMINDIASNKGIKVTSPYFLVKLIMDNYKHQEGLGRALAGKTYGTISGYIENTLDFNPVASQMALLFKNKINYLVEDFDGIRFMSHSTSQKKDDALSELPNVIVVNRLIRIMQDACEDFQFSRNKPEKIAEFNQLLTEKADLFKTINNYAIEKIEVNVTQSDYDKIQKIARVTISIKFYDFIYSIILSFTVA